MLHNWTKNAIVLFQRAVATLSFPDKDEMSALADLSRRYANIPMSLAVASLVRMSELSAEVVVVTLDSDFLIYRRNRRQKIPLANVAEN